MTETQARWNYALIAMLIVASGVGTWIALTIHNRPGAPAGTASNATGPAPSATPAALAPPPTASATVGPAANGAGGTSAQANAQDQRQLAKITRGLVANPGGGILVRAVDPGTVAGQLRVEAGDVIVSVNGEPVASPEEFARIYREQGLPRQMTVIHNGREMHRH